MKIVKSAAAFVLTLACAIVVSFFALVPLAIGGVSGLVIGLATVSLGSLITILAVVVAYESGK